MKDRLLPLLIVAGPPATQNDTGNPDEALALSASVFVAICVPMVAKVIFWPKSAVIVRSSGVVPP